MQSLQGGEDAMLRLDQLEALYYELQLQLYDIQAEVLRCEELLLTAQLQSLRRQMTGERLCCSFRTYTTVYFILFYSCHFVLITCTLMSVYTHWLTPLIYVKSVAKTSETPLS